jgi:haloalkane dehalogenase
MQLTPSLRAEYPFEGRYLDVGGLRYHYLDEGQGEPLVMVHGNPTWSFYYRRLVRGLSDRYRCIVPDHIGCGLSDKPGDDEYEFTLERRVADLERLIDHLDLGERVTLVLHDWGGMIGMVYAARHPHRIKRIIVSNTSAFPLPATKPLPLALRICRNTALGALLVRGCNAFSRAAITTCVKRRPLTGAAREGYLAPYDSWSNRRAVLRFVQDIPLAEGDPSWPLVAGVEAATARLARIPLLIVWGADDFVFDDHFLDGWRRRYPSAEIHRLAGVGHYVLEDAWEETVPLVRNFLERHPLQPEGASR